MKKGFFTFLIICAGLTLTACDKNDSHGEGKLIGKAKGFGGEIIVEVKKNKDTILEVFGKGSDKNNTIEAMVIEDISKAIVKANSADVDHISGATITSKAVMYAVNNAINPTEYPYDIE